MEINVLFEMEMHMYHASVVSQRSSEERELIGLEIRC